MPISECGYIPFGIRGGFAFARHSAFSGLWTRSDLAYRLKQGEIKDSGSPFKEMTPKERQVWQDLVDTAYNQFLGADRITIPGLVQQAFS